MTVSDPTSADPSVSDDTLDSPDTSASDETSAPSGNAPADTSRDTSADTSPGTSADNGSDSSYDELQLDDPKQLYRLLEEILEGIDDLDGVHLPTAFVEALVDDHGKSLGLRSGAAYEERRARFHRSPTLRKEWAESHAASFDATGLLLTRDDPTGLWGPKASVPWRPGGKGPGVAACLVHIGQTRYLVTLEMEPGVSPIAPDLVIHALRSVLASRLQGARWGSTMRQAASIQRSLLPGRAPIFADYDIAAVSLAAEEVGGDFFDFLPMGDREESIGLLIGDASGHGLPAALVARDVVVGLRMGMEKDKRIAPTLERLNRIIHRGGPSSSFVSLFYGELEANGNLFYVNAGHRAPMLLRGGRQDPLELESGDIVMGPVPDARFKRCFVHVDRGDCLVLYTDGVNERQETDGGLFGTERMIDVLREVRDEPSQAIVDALLGAAARFGDGTPWSDDASVCVIKRPE